MIWQFILNPDSDNLEIDDPIGWEEMRLHIKRNETWHGVFFEYTTGSLEFTGDAYQFLKEQKELYGLHSIVDLKINFKCGADDEFEFFYQGRLNFGKAKENCGARCSITLPMENSGCIVTFNSRYNQKVDIQKTVSSNGVSALQPYAALGYTLPLSAVAVDVSIEGYVGDGDPDRIQFTINQTTYGRLHIRPTYADERFNAIKTGQLTPVSNFYGTHNQVFGPLTPQLLYDDNVDCFSEDFTYEIRLKGSYSFTLADGIDPGTTLKLQLFTWDGEGVIFTDKVVISETTIDSGSLPISGTFDHTFSGTILPNPGEGLYAVMYLETGNVVVAQIEADVTFDEETSFLLTANKLCPSTNAEVFLVHETLSRAVEAITDNCMRVKSEYYGRTDSEPFAFDDDGCGSLRTLTNGLKLRQAPESLFFISVKELFDSLNSIDNIGLGIEEDLDRPGYQIARIEDVGYFYRDEEAHVLDHISEGEKETLEDKHYSIIEGGYDKWEVEEINGLDEVHASREYHSTLTTVNNTLDLKSKFVAGSYPIEITRQQSFVDTGAADTTYDNETFIICVKRQGSIGFEVEQGNVTDAENLYSPQTIYNWRIRPIYNLMRWFKSIAGMYANLGDSRARIDFSAGEGNYKAKGEMESIFCKLETNPIGENETINKNKFANVEDYTPIWKPEQFKAEYPFSVKDYKKVKAKPYGYLSYQCGNGDYEKGYVDEIIWHINEGKAEFTLRKKYVN